MKVIQHNYVSINKSKNYLNKINLCGKILFKLKQNLFERILRFLFHVHNVHRKLKIKKTQAHLFNRQKKKITARKTVRRKSFDIS